MNEQRRREWKWFGCEVLFVALLIVGTMLCGCSTNWTKGEGSLCRFELSFLEAPISGQGGAQVRRGYGPADAVAGRHLAQPVYPVRETTVTPDTRKPLNPVPKPMTKKEWEQYVQIQDGHIRPVGRK